MRNIYYIKKRKKNYKNEIKAILKKVLRKKEPKKRRLQKDQYLNQQI